MALLNESLSVRALFEFRENLELGDGMFKEITGIDAKDLMAFRRGRRKEKPIITPRAAERIVQCKKAFGLALEFCGDQDRALDWFYADAPSFGGKSPIDLTLTLGGLEKIQSFIDSLRKAVAAASLNGAVQTSTPTSDAKTAEVTAGVRPEKPVPPNVVVKADPIMTESKTTPVNIPAPSAHLSIPAASISAPPSTGYTPGGMARSRAQALVPAQPPRAEATAEPTLAALNESVPASSPPTAALPKKTETVPTAEPTPAIAPLQSVDAAPQENAPTHIPDIRRQFAPPPTGVDPERRIFLLKEPFTRLREKKPDLTLKEISAAMLKRGCTRFLVQTHASRLVKSYTWATWTEVVNLAEILEADPYDLGSVRSE